MHCEKGVGGGLMLAYLGWHKPWTVMMLCIITVILFLCGASEVGSVDVKDVAWWWELGGSGVVDCGCCCLLSWEPTDKWFHICFFEHKHDHMVCVQPQGI